MADESMVIYNFAALESAINSFTASSSHISELTGQLRSNASAIQTAVVSAASEVYAGKMAILAGNFATAEERLTAEVQNLKMLADKAHAAEAQAKAIADGVETYNLS